MKKAFFAGSFDPITLGHIHLIERVLPLFDQVIIGIGINTSKKTLFTKEQRLSCIQKIFAHEKKIEVIAYEKLTIEACAEYKAQYIVRGIRNVTDFEYEKIIAQNNYLLNPDIETLFITPTSEYAHISSTIVRELIAHKGSISHLVPPSVLDYIDL